MEAFAGLRNRIDLARLLAMPETVRDYASDLWAHPATPAVVLFVSGCFVVRLHDALATPAPRARGRHRRLSEAKSEGPDNEPSGENLPPGLLPGNEVPSRDLPDERIPPAGPSKQDDTLGDPSEQDTWPISPSEHSDVDSDPPEQDISLIFLSESQVADGDLPKEASPPTTPPKQDILPTDPLEQDVLTTNPQQQESPPISPSEHSVTESDALEPAVPDSSPIAECIDPEDEIAPTNIQDLDRYQESLREVHNVLMYNEESWLRLSRVILAGQAFPLRDCNLFQDPNCGQASPLLKILQGPVKHTPEILPTTRDTDIPFCEIVEYCAELTDTIHELLLPQPDAIKATIELNALALKRIRSIIRGGDFSVLAKMEGLVTLMEQNKKLISRLRNSIDNALADYANLITKRQEQLDELVMTTTSDQIITLMNAPSGWETLHTKNGFVAKENQEHAHRAHNSLSSGLGSGAAAPADIVNHVHELSRTFRGGSKETLDPKPQLLVQAPVLSSQITSFPRSAADTQQHTGEIKQLLKAREDMDKLSVKIECIYKNRQTSRKYEEAMINGQEL